MTKEKATKGLTAQEFASIGIRTIWQNKRTAVFLLVTLFAPYSITEGSYSVAGKTDCSILDRTTSFLWITVILIFFYMILTVIRVLKKPEQDPLAHTLHEMRKRGGRGKKVLIIAGVILGILAAGIGAVASIQFSIGIEVSVTGNDSLLQFLMAPFLIILALLGNFLPELMDAALKRDNEIMEAHEEKSSEAEGNQLTSSASPCQPPALHSRLEWILALSVVLFVRMCWTLVQRLRKEGRGSARSTGPQHLDPAAGVWPSPGSASGTGRCAPDRTAG